MNEKKARPKVLIGIILLILTPMGLFVKPATGSATIRDLVMVIWWAFVIWLLGHMAYLSNWVCRDARPKDD